MSSSCSSSSSSAILAIGIEHIAAVMTNAPDVYVLNESTKNDEDVSVDEVRRLIDLLRQRHPAVTEIEVVNESITTFGGQYEALEWKQDFEAKPIPNIRVSFQAGALLHPRISEQARELAKQTSIPGSCALVNVYARMREKFAAEHPKNE